MKLFLTLLAFIALLTVLLLVSKVRFFVFCNLEQGIDFSLSFWFFKISLNKKINNGQASRQKNKPKKKPAKKNTLKEMTEKHGISYTVSFLFDCVKKVFGGLKKITSHIIGEKINIDICVASDDAAATAIQYGTISAAVYPIIGALESKNKIKKQDIKIYTDYTKTTPSLYCDICICVRLFYVVLAALSTVFSIIFKGVRKNG